MLIKPISFWQQAIVSGAPIPPADKYIYLNGYNFKQYNGTNLGSAVGGGIAKIGLNGVLDTTWTNAANPASSTNQVRFANQTGGNIYADCRTTSSTIRGFRKISAATGTVALTVASTGGTIWNVNANPLITDFIIVTGDNVTTTFNGVTYKGVGKINTADLSVNTTFKTNTGTGTNGFVQSAHVSETRIGVCGQFTAWNATAVSDRFVVLNHDGTRDAGFNRTGAFNGNVNTALQLGSKWFVGGLFTTVNSVTNNRLVCFNSDGTVDTTFTTNLGTGFNGAVNSLVRLTDTSFLVLGGFTTANGATRNRIAVVNTDGTIQSNIYGTGFNSGAPQYTTIDTTTGIIYASGAGPFTTYNGTATNNIVAINPDGTITTAFVYGTGMRDSTNAVAESGGLTIS